MQELLPVITAFITLREALFDFFFGSFFFERDYLLSVLAFESAARQTNVIKLKIHSGTRPVSAGLHAVFFKKIYKSTILFRIIHVFSQKARFKHNSQCVFLRTMKKLIPLIRCHRCTNTCVSRVNTDKSSCKKKKEGRNSSHT